MMMMLLVYGGLALLAFLFYRRCYAERKGLPPGPLPIPLIDNLLSFDMKDVLGSSLRFHQKYGDVYTLWSMGKPIIMINSAPLIRKYFGGERGEAASGRMLTPINDIMYGRPNVGIVNATGEIWRESRRFSLHTLRDFGVGKALMEIWIREEAEKMILSLAEEGKKGTEALHPLDNISTGVINVVSRVIFGHSYAAGDPQVRAIKDAIQAFQEVGFNPALILLAYFPSLRHVPLFKHFGADYLSDFGGRLFTLMEAEISAIESSYDAANDPSNFVEAYLKEMKERRDSGKDLGHMSTFQLSRIVGDFWTAGFETTLTTLSWLPIYMVNYPEVQAKIHQELDDFYGMDGKEVAMGDRNSIPYTAAAVMELQRVANILPFNVAHTALEDLQIEGYLVKKGSLLMPQISSVLHDPRIFPEPKLYRPERFLDEAGKLKPSEAFVPFSVGKRACAGEPLARAELFIFFVSLLRAFEMSASPLPTFETAPGGAQKPLPYKVAFTPRPSPTYIM